MTMLAEIQTDVLVTLPVAPGETQFVPIRYAPIVATLPTNIIVAPVLLPVPRSIAVLAYVLSANGQTDVVWTGSSGPMGLVEGQAFSVVGTASQPLFILSPGAPLTLEVTGLKTVGGHLTYMVL